MFTLQNSKSSKTNPLTISRPISVESRHSNSSQPPNQTNNYQNNIKIPSNYESNNSTVNYIKHDHPNYDRNHHIYLQNSHEPPIQSINSNRRLHSPPGYSYPIDIQACINPSSFYQQSLNHPQSPHYTTPQQSGLPPSVPSSSAIPNHYSHPNQSTINPSQSQPSYHYSQPFHPQTKKPYTSSNPPSRAHTPTSLQYQQPRNQPVNPLQHPQQHPLSNNYGSQTTIDSTTNYQRDPSGKKYALLQFNGPLIGQEIDV